jgi:anthranilate phosphoribosyltransferase
MEIMKKGAPMQVLSHVAKITQEVGTNG